MVIEGWEFGKGQSRLSCNYTTFWAMIYTQHTKPQVNQTSKYYLLFPDPQMPRPDTALLSVYQKQRETLNIQSQSTKLFRSLTLSTQNLVSTLRYNDHSLHWSITLQRIYDWLSPSLWVTPGDRDLLLIMIVCWIALERNALPNKLP